MAPRWRKKPMRTVEGAKQYLAEVNNIAVLILKNNENTKKSGRVRNV